MKHNRTSTAANESSVKVPLKLEDVIKEYNKCKEAMEIAGVSNYAFIIYTNKKLGFDISNLNEKIFIVCKSNFVNFYSPTFAFRARLAFCKNIVVFNSLMLLDNDTNINSLPYQHLLAVKGIGRALATKIMTMRENKPFEVRM
jgi:hypothetical protein